MGILGIYYYWVFAILLMIGFFAVIAKPNLIKKLIGLSLFQAAVFLLYITMGKVDGGTAPIFHDIAQEALLYMGEQAPMRDRPLDEILARGFTDRAEPPLDLPAVDIPIDQQTLAATGGLG